MRQPSRRGCPAPYAGPGRCLDSKSPTMRIHRLKDIVLGHSGFLSDGQRALKRKYIITDAWKR